MSEKSSNQSTQNNHRTTYLHTKKNTINMVNHFLIPKKNIIKKKKIFPQTKTKLFPSLEKKRIVQNKKYNMKMNMKI